MTQSLEEMLRDPDRDRWYRMEANDTERTAEVILYGAIGGWFGVQAIDFVRELADLDVDRIDLRVNSPGGLVYDGLAIMNALRRHEARVVATVDGLAASAASFLIQAADEVVMGRGSELMIHDAWSIALGSAEDLHKEADHLDKLSQSMAGIYAERAGGTADEWREAMLAETWYSAEEAVAAGLADRTEAGSTGDDDADDEAAALFLVESFAHAGRSDAPAPHIPAAAHRRSHGGLSLVNGSPLRTALHVAAQATHRPPAEPEDITHPEKKEASDMSEKLIQGLRERLGITAELDDDGLLAAVDEALAEQADTPTGQTATTAPPEGTVLVDADQFAALQADAAAGREARDAQIAADRTATVAAAVADGRIAPARREHWEAQLAADPGAAEVLAGLAKGTIPVTAAGFTGGVDEATDEDGELYSKFWPSTDATKEA